VGAGNAVAVINGATNQVGHRQHPAVRRRAISSRGLFTGSGVVEAGCKAIPVDQRLNFSGIRWTVAGAGAIIALRRRETGSQWEEMPEHDLAAVTAGLAQRPLTRLLHYFVVTPRLPNPTGDGRQPSDAGCPAR
jgi:hypothetical protein